MSSESEQSGQSQQSSRAIFDALTQFIRYGNEAELMRATNIPNMSRYTLDELFRQMRSSFGASPVQSPLGAPFDLSSPVMEPVEPVESVEPLLDLSSPPPQSLPSSLPSLSSPSMMDIQEIAYTPKIYRIDPLIIKRNNSTYSSMFHDVQKNEPFDKVPSENDRAAQQDLDQVQNNLNMMQQRFLNAWITSHIGDVCGISVEEEPAIPGVIIAEPVTIQTSLGDSRDYVMLLVDIGSQCLRNNQIYQGLRGNYPEAKELEELQRYVTETIVPRIQEKLSGARLQYTQDIYWCRRYLRSPPVIGAYAEMIPNPAQTNDLYWSITNIIQNPC